MMCSAQTSPNFLILTGTGTDEFIETLSTVQTFNIAGFYFSRK